MISPTRSHLCCLNCKMKIIWNVNIKILDITTRRNKETCSVVVGSTQQGKLWIQNCQLVSFFSLQIAFSITHIIQVLHTTNTCFNCFVLAWIVCFFKYHGHKFFPIFHSWCHWIKNQQVYRYNIHASISVICTTTYWKIQDQPIQPPCTGKHGIRCAGKCRVTIVFLLIYFWSFNSCS